MKNSHTYNIARSSTRILLYKSTPPTPSRKNIFTDERRKWHGRELDTAKNYEVVGLKQLKSYQNKLKKTSRATLRVDSLSTERPLSKTSTDTKKQDLDLLTKQEVMDLLPKAQQQQDLPEPLPTSPKMNKRQSQITFSTDLPHPPIIFPPHLTHFSLTRLKKRIKEHRKEWSNHQQRENSKFPNIYRSIEMHRLKLEHREEEGRPDENLVNTRSNLWGETLRNGKKLRDICCKKDLTRTLHDENSFLARGYSKIDREKQWLQRKDEAGFKFKLYPDGIPDELKRTVVIR